MPQLTRTVPTASKVTRFRAGRMAFVILALCASSRFSASAANLAGTAAPIRFEPNVGQTSGGADFIARGLGYGVGLKSGEVSLQMRRRTGVQGGSPVDTNLRMSLLGSKPGAA